jgi:hypothetical protein
VAERTNRRDPSVWEWSVMIGLGAALFAYGAVSARTGLPPQPETVVGPVFDQVAGIAVAVFALAGLAVTLRARSSGGHGATANAGDARHTRRARPAGHVVAPGSPGSSRRSRRAPTRPRNATRPARAGLRSR